MKRSTRLLCLIIVALMVFGTLFAIIASVAYAAVQSEKSETVYITADSTGAPLSVLSSVYVTNPEKREQLADTTRLTDIKNVGGSEAPVVQEDGSVLFRADGEDVYYQGAMDADELPVTMQVTYTLDGKAIDAAALAGKSGRVGITIAYANKHTQETVVKEETLALYTPFTVVTMLTLDEHFRNISAEDAKVMSEAGVNTITGMTFPGLAKNIEAEPKERLAERFTVTADVVDFELDAITAIVLTGIMDADDLGDLDDIQEMTDGVDEMSDAGDDLYDGTRKLYDGAKEFSDGLSEYLDGIAELYDGSIEASDGTAELYDGADELADGAEKLFEGVDKLFRELSGAGSGSGANVDQAAAQAKITELAGQATAEIISSLISAGVDPAIASGLQAAIGGYTAKAAGDAYAAGAEAAGKAAQAAISSQMGALQDGVYELRNGAEELADGARELAAGVHKMREGMIDIEEALEEINENAQELRDGAEELTDGLRKLRNGVKELNEEGLKELSSNTSDMKILLERKDAMVALGEDYQTFSGIAEGMAGTVKFVFETQSIFVEKPIETAQPEGTPQDDQPTAEPGFFARVWSWIKNLFGAS